MSDLELIDAVARKTGEDSGSNPEPESLFREIDQQREEARNPSGVTC